jgi:hypothetical protein
MPPDGKLIFFYCFITFISKCLDCLMIFNIELPFSLNKTRIGNQIRIRICAYDERIQIQEPKKHWSSSIYSSSTDILYHFLSDWGFLRKLFAKSLQNFVKTVTPFVKVFVFVKGQKSVFVPTLIVILMSWSRAQEENYPCHLTAKMHNTSFSHSFEDI